MIDPDDYHTRYLLPHGRIVRWIDRNVEDIVVTIAVLAIFSCGLVTGYAMRGW